MSGGPPLLIVGASTRAAAWSAIRAGYSPICADRYADEDLRAVAQVLPLPERGGALREMLRNVPESVPWFYTGAMENHPRRIEAISANRELLGNSAEVVRALRNPLEERWERVRECLPAYVTIPTSRPSGNPPAADGRWMLKPCRGSAGRGISVWDADAALHPTLKEPHFFQQRVEGFPISALCRGDVASAEVLGFSRQWIGETNCHAAQFQYCGSIGPIDVPDAVREGVRVLAEVVARQFALRGIFGCDLLFDGERAALTEVNPRYTASVEIYEFATGVPLLPGHIAACRRAAATIESEPHRPSAGGEMTVRLPRRERAIPVATEGSPSVISPPGQARWGQEAKRVVGKAILYAPINVEFPPISFRPFDGTLPPLADLPAGGSRIPRGAPVCTLFAQEHDARHCEASLRHQATEWSRRFFG